jgi:hypothetical protein
MALNNDWVFGLTQDFQKIIVTNEIETREYGSLLLKEVI